MNRIMLVAALIILGLVMAALGVSMLLLGQSLLASAVVTALIGGGLGLILVSTLLLVATELLNIKGKSPASNANDAAALAFAPTPLPHQDQLVAVMDDLRNAALDLIERRREIHHLNTHQWHYAHRDETTQEIAANKRYRQAKSALELHRLSLPTEFWSPLDSFCDAIDLSMSREVYSPPNDKSLHQSFDRLWHTTMREIHGIVSGRPDTEEARQLAD